MNAPPITADAMSRSPADGAVWTRVADAVFQSRSALGAMTGVFVLAGLGLVLGRGALQDEGLLTWVFARWVTIEPLAVVFFQKVKPVPSMIYALPSLGAPEIMLGVHVLIAALTAPMLAAVARALGHRLPNLPAFIVLVSPLFLFGAAAGVSNVDGVVATTLFLYLAVALRRDSMAGLVLGCIPWVRSELAPFAIVLWLYMALVERRRGIALGTFIFPLLYGMAGAAYHRDLLWLTHFPPATTFPMPGNPLWEQLTIDPRDLQVTLLLVTPAVVFALGLRARRLSPVERVLCLWAALSVLLLSVLPFLRLGNFSSAARYSLQPLPVFALLAARAVEPWLEQVRAPWTVYLLPTALAAIGWASGAAPAIVAIPLLGCSVAVAICGWCGRGRIAACAVGIAACLGLAMPRGQLATPEFVSPALAWLADHADEVGGATLYTNSPELAFAIARAPGLGPDQIRFIVAPDMLWEIGELSNVANGQRHALQRIARDRLFPPSLPWNEIGPDTVPRRSLFVLRHDPRLPLLLPETAWANRRETVGGGEGFTIERVRPAGDAQAEQVRG